MVTAHDEDDAGHTNGTSGLAPGEGDHTVVAQPSTETEGPMAAAGPLSAAQYALGQPGNPLSRRSPFFIGMSVAAGVAVTVGVIEMIITVRDVLVLIGLALFLAVGL